MKETWRPVVGFEDLYEVSDFGRVRNIATGRGRRLFQVLRPGTNKVGYKIICLFRKHEGVTKTVHRLVAQVFIPNPHCKPEVNHKNAIKTDNRSANLEWVTRLENARHSEALHLRTSNPPKGEANIKAKLTATKVRAIRNQLLDGSPGNALATTYGVTPQAIHAIKHRRTWAHVD